MKNTRDSLIGYEYHVLIFKYNKILFLHLMNIININLEHCFGITKLSQKLNFAGENVVLIYAPNGLMKTSFARTMQLYTPIRDKIAISCM